MFRIIIAASLLIPVLASAGTAIINGNVISTQNGGSIVINNNKVYIDGKDVTPDSKQISITVKGDIKNLECGHCSTLKVTGNVDDIQSASGNVNVTGNVTGNVSTASGDVSVKGNVAGSVKTMSGDVTNTRHRNSGIPDECNNGIFSSCATFNGLRTQSR